MLKTKNIYTNILDIRCALMQSKEIIAKLEKENSSLKQTLEEFNVEKQYSNQEYMYYEHIHTIKEG